MEEIHHQSGTESDSDSDTLTDEIFNNNDIVEALNRTPLSKKCGDLTVEEMMAVFSSSLNMPTSKRVIRNCVQTEVNTLKSERIDPLEKKVTKLQEETNSMKQDTLKIMGKLEGLEAGNSQNSTPRTFIQREETSRQGNLIFRGVKKEGEGKTPLDSIKAILRDLGIELNGAVQARRIGPRDKRDSILVEFSVYWDRRKVYAARTKLAGAGHKGIFLNEDLTMEQKHVFYEARQAKKQGMISSCWTYEGVTHLSKDSNDGKVTAAIPNMETLKLRLPQYTPTKEFKVPDSTRKDKTNWNKVTPRRAAPERANSSLEEGEIEEEGAPTQTNPKDNKGKAEAPTSDKPKTTPSTHKSRQPKPTTPTMHEPIASTSSTEETEAPRTRGQTAAKNKKKVE